ncbi:MAG TPA: hypothetical protein VNH46_13500, partial [Gemmatimonadales bacterium]|nr:hypothetical protein [Gemmatimonadales bacterium]
AALLTAEPAALALLPTERGRVEIRALKVDGTPAGPTPLTWKSLRPEVAVVSDTTGGITALSTGQAVVQATAPGGVSVSVPVTVSLAEFSLDTEGLVLAPGDLDTLVVTVPSQGGRRLHPADLQWSASDPTVVQVSPQGVVRALMAGRAEVLVQGFLQERRVPVVVHQPVAHFLVSPRLGETVRLPLETSREFAVIPQTADSVPIGGVPLIWTVGDTAVASFDPATGRLLGRRVGSTTIAFAARGFLPTSWKVEVLPGAVALDRSAVSLRPTERLTIGASFVDTDGKPVMPATGLVWSSSDTGIVRVTAAGVVEGVLPGRVTVTARAPAGEPATATVIVTGDVLLSSSRGGRFGIYALAARSPDHFVPVVADSAANSVDASYSPDRSRLVYASDQFDHGNYDIVVADADGRHPVRLTNSAAIDHQPVWAPDGRRIVFVSGRDRLPQLYVMNADGSEVRQLTRMPGGAEEPAISADGKQVAFTGYPGDREGQSAIYLVPLAGGVPVAVSGAPDRKESRAAWLPDGSLAWMVQRRDKRDPDLVVKQGPGGGAPTPLVTTDRSLVDLAIARDGSRIAWVASRVPERSRSGVEYTFQWRPLPGGVDTVVRLLPGERITSPAF